ncbi:amidohydrolase family protein [Microbacterium sp.]|uniref:amidohydrolase family protein n=1 Tax=Microbacterium sp. TaxID=51671 RepID=UPI003A8AC287
MRPDTHADTIIQNVFLVTFDRDATVIADGALAIRDGVIVDRGSTAEVTARWSADQRVFGGGQIAIPGLTDAHFHTAQSLMRGMLATLQQRTRLRVPTWREYYLPFEAALSPDDIALSGEFAYATMLRTGTTNVLEAGGPHPERMGEAAQRAGIRATVTASTMDGGSRVPPSMIMTAEEAVARNIEVVEAFPAEVDGSRRVTGGMSLRQVITCSPELVQTIHAEARRRGVTVHTHLAEGTYEIDYCLEHFGRRPVDHLIDLGVFTRTLHCAHSILVDDAEIASFAVRGVTVCHCAKGNYAIGAAPAARMWRRGVGVGLGTDGVATLGTLDMFRVAMLTGLGQQLVEATPTHNRNGIPPEEPLQMAITGGALAGRQSDVIGSLEVGKRADVVLLTTTGPDAAAYASEEAFLYECASGRDVTTVLVDGEVVVSDGEVQTLDYERVCAVAAARQAELANVIA